MIGWFMILEKHTEVFVFAFWDFRPGASVLCVEEGTDAFSSYLAKKGLAVSSASIRRSASDKYADENEGAFDYIVAAGILERCFMPELVLRQWCRLLKDGGTLLLATRNRLGVQYFCGDRDPFTRNVFDSIENYRRIKDPAPKAMGGKLYARAEIETMLEGAHFV